MKSKGSNAKADVHKHERNMHPGKAPTPLKGGGAAKKYSTGGRVSPFADYSSKHPMAGSAK
jgi:hypothetical protein